MMSSTTRAVSGESPKTKKKDWSSAALLLAPSVIMHVMVVVLHTAVPANLVFHAFMVGAILAHGWSLRLGANALRHREGSLARPPDGGDARTRNVMAARAFWLMLAIGLGQRPVAVTIFERFGVGKQ